MASNPAQIRALLVGIDQYSKTNDGENLDGCVRDVENIYDILLKLGIPPGNVATLTAPLPGHATPSLGSPRSPTRDNVLKELDKIKNMKKQPGDVFIFHYSGHGDRRRTKHRWLKGFNAKDELFCTLGDDISDVELGGRLSELETQGVTVFAILDCCHSGGLDRKSSRGKRRCRNREPTTNDHGDYDHGRSVNASEPEDGAHTSKRRNAVLGPSYLYRSREYNVIAACQPREFACEVWRPNTDGIDESHGALTYHLAESILSLEESQEPVTYEHLQGVLTAKMQSVDDVTQHPKYFGEENRVVFSADVVKGGGRYLRASVIQKNKGSLTLNKGLASSIAVGDRFLLFSPSQSFMGLVTADYGGAVEVEVSRVEGSRAIVVPYDSGQTTASIQSVHPGWVAQLYKRATPVVVRVSLPKRMDPHAEKRLRERWHSYIDPCMPVALQFGRESNKPAFSVDVSQPDGIFRVRDEDARPPRPILHLPRVEAEGPENVEQLMGLLHHLCTYRLVAKIPTSKSSMSPRYDFEVESVSHDKDSAYSLGAWKVRFRNRHTQPLYVTILNLTPAYGVSMSFPGKHDSTEELGPGDEIEDRGSKGFIIEIEPPDLLLGSVPTTMFLNGPPTELAARATPVNPDFEMKDVLKLFVTTAPQNFNHYKLPDLEENPEKLATRLKEILRGQGQRAKRREYKVPIWTVDEIVITTPERKSKWTWGWRRGVVHREVRERKLVIAGLVIAGGVVATVGWKFWPLLRELRPWRWLRA